MSSRPQKSSFPKYVVNRKHGRWTVLGRSVVGVGGWTISKPEREVPCVVRFEGHSVALFDRDSAMSRSSTIRRYQ